MDILKSKDLDKIVVTNSVDQREHKRILGDKLDVLEVGQIFSEVSGLSTETA